MMSCDCEISAMRWSEIRFGERECDTRAARQRDKHVAGADTVAESLQVGDLTLVWGRRTYVMGVLNATPDSFSGDGVSGSRDALRRAVDTLVEAAPDIIDVGGESTRPGAPQVSVAEEIERVLPAVRELRQASSIPVSVDTRRAPVARASLEAGADAINDVTGLLSDPELVAVAAAWDVPVVLTHNRRARAAHSDLGGFYPDVRYDDLMAEIVADSQRLIDSAISAGIRREHLVFDPGFGFGKTPAQNVELLARLGELRTLGLPILVGASRKSFVGHLLGLPASERLEGSLAAAVIAVAHGAHMVRAHDVTATRRALAVADAVFRRV